MLAGFESDSFTGTFTPPPVIFPVVVVLPTGELLLALICANASKVLFPDALDMVAVIIKADKAKIATKIKLRLLISTFSIVMVI